MFELDRRMFLRGVGAAGLVTLAGEAGAAGAAGPVAPQGEGVVHEVLAAQEAVAPKYSVKFAVCGMSHDHIYGMIEAVRSGGGVLVAAWAGEPDKLAGFKRRFPDVKGCGDAG